MSTSSEAEPYPEDRGLACCHAWKLTPHQRLHDTGRPVSGAYWIRLDIHCQTCDWRWAPSSCKNLGSGIRCGVCRSHAHAYLYGRGERQRCEHEMGLAAAIGSRGHRRRRGYVNGPRCRFNSDMLTTTRRHVQCSVIHSCTHRWRPRELALASATMVRYIVDRDRFGVYSRRRGCEYLEPGA